MKAQEVDFVKKMPGDAATDIFELIHGVMHRFRNAQYHVIRDCCPGLTHAEGKILGYFARNSGASLSELSSCTGQDKGQLGRSIKSLRSGGLLEGTGCAEDRRRVSLSITEQGAEIHNLLEKQHRKLESVVVKGLSADEQAMLVSLLERVRANLDEEPS